MKEIAAGDAPRTEEEERAKHHAHAAKHWYAILEKAKETARAMAEFAGTPASMEDAMANIVITADSRAAQEWAEYKKIVK